MDRDHFTVQENSSAVRTAQAIRSKKNISRSNGLRYTFEKIHQAFERLELSVRISRSNGSSFPFKKVIHRPFEWLYHKKKQYFFLWKLLHFTNSRHVSVLCLPSLNKAHPVTTFLAKKNLKTPLIKNHVFSLKLIAEHII